VSRLDPLLQPWPPTTESLRDLLARDREERPREGLFFEFKQEIDPEKGYLPKTVAAFANAEGGFLFWGASEGDGEDKGVLVAFPGLPAGQEWALRASNEISRISPAPAWRPVIVQSPTATDRVVVVIRVEKSARPPHVVPNGRIYVRTPGGSSDPLTDRSSLDRLVERGRDEAQRIQEQLGVLDALNGDFLHSAPPRPDRSRISIATIPTPLDAAPRPEILTKAGYNALPAMFGGPLWTKGTLQQQRLLEDAVELDHGYASFRVFSDGSLKVWSRSLMEGDRGLPMSLVRDVVLEALQYEARIGADECAIAFRLDGAQNVRIRDGDLQFGNWQRESEYPPPNPWTWRGTSLTSTDAATGTVSQLIRRLWRASGIAEFEP
jgi:hypothetical protein